MKSDKVAPVAVAKPRGKAPARAKAPSVDAAPSEAAEPEHRNAPSDEIVTKISNGGDGAAAPSAPAVAEEPDEVVVMSTEQVKEQAKKQVAAAVSAPAAAMAPFEDVDRFNRENMEAVMRAATAVAKCCEELGAEWMNYAKASMDESVAVSKALMGCTSMEEAIDVQAGFVKSALDQYLSESTRLSEISLRMANEAFEPLNARFGVAVETLGRPVSA
ncbi:MAG: phasin family protein [Alphaproteobacteria bacterium]